MNRNATEKPGDETAAEKVPIMYLTNNLPYPPDSGGQLREYQLLKRLTSQFSVHLIAFVSKRSGRDEITACKSFLASVTEVITTPSLAPADIPARMRDCFSDCGAEIIRNLIATSNFGLIHVEGYFLMHYLPKHSPLPVVLVAENIEYAIEQDAVALGYMNFDPLSTESFEVAAWSQATVCICVTPQDAAIVRTRNPFIKVECITNGIDHLYGETGHSKCAHHPSKQCLYIANFSWTPSRDAALHLLRDIWPTVYERVPDSQLILAGAGMDASLKNTAALTSGVKVRGPYKKLQEVSSQTDLFLFPMRFGGGIKVKLGEAITSGLPVVTSPQALNGFPEELNEFVWTAITPEEFVNAVVAALSKEDERAYKAQNANNLVRSAMPSWDTVANELAAAWRACQKGHMK